MIAVAFVAVTTLAAALGLIAWLVYRLSRADETAVELTEQHGEARVQIARLEGRLTVALTDVENQTKRADTEQRRADAFDDQLDQVALSGDAAGARVRVLARTTRAAAAETSSRDQGILSTIPGPEGAAVVDREGLLRPGE